MNEGKGERYRKLFPDGDRKLGGRGTEWGHILLLGPAWGWYQGLQGSARSPPVCGRGFPTSHPLFSPI